MVFQGTPADKEYVLIGSLNAPTKLVFHKPWGRGNDCLRLAKGDLEVTLLTGPHIENGDLKDSARFRVLG